MKNLSLLTSLAGLALLSLVGCGGATEFTGGAATQIAGTPPPPPPAPPPPPKVETVKHVQVKDDHIEIDEKIQFELAKSNILPVSNNLLDEIASTMKEHSEIKKVEIQGHASAEGDAAKNKTLSDLRAKAVMAALVTRGIDAGRMTAKGYGVEKPIADNKTEEGREKNRRVEFLITDPAPKGGAAVTAPAPAEGDAKKTAIKKKAAAKKEEKK